MEGLRRATLDDVPAVMALQQAAYAPNRTVLGVEPKPLQADYATIVVPYETWLAEGPDGLEGALILDRHEDHLLIWSVSVAPAAQGRGLGTRFLAAAEERARRHGLTVLRLYTGEKLTRNIAWYQRHGYAIERAEALADRNIVHMVKTIEL